MVPMLKEDELIGAIGNLPLRRSRRSPTSRSSWCTNFADQAVIAIENVRLLNELRARTDELARSVGELQALGEVSQAVNSTLDLEQVLTTIVATCGAALRAPMPARSTCSTRRARSSGCAPPTA